MFANDDTTTIFEHEKSADQAAAASAAESTAAQPAISAELSSAAAAPSEPAEPAPDLSAPMRDFLTEYEGAMQYEKRASLSPIRVDELASKVAKLYERLRVIVDWKEENIVRRTAIERILKRNLLPEISGMNVLDPDRLAEPLVLELIRSGYFSNGTIPQEKVAVVRDVLARYIFIINNSPLSKGANLPDKLKVKQKINFFSWILEIAACELEQVLDPALRMNALLNLMTNSIYSKLKVIPHDRISDDDRLIQTYIAVHRTLFALDEPIITFNLIKIRYPEWFEGNPDYISYFTNNITSIQAALEADLNHPQAKHFYTICERYDAAYLTIGDIFKKITLDIKNPQKAVAKLNSVLASEEEFELALDEVYAARMKTLKGRLMRSAIYSTLSIFVSGLASYILFEGPIARFVHGSFSWWALIVDLGVPAAIMFLLVISIRLPPASNLKKLKDEVRKVIFADYEDDRIAISLNKKKHFILNGLFGLISLAAGSLTAFGIFTIFKWGGVPWTSLYIDTITVGMIIFAAMVIRDRSKEMSVEEGSSLTDFIVDLFTIPLARVGQWFARVWHEYNIFSVFFTVLVDTPFSVIIGLIEDWRGFLKDARSELR